MNTFVMVQARTNIKAMCLSVYYGVKLWNSLSNNLRDCNSVTIFKKTLLYLLCVVFTINYFEFGFEWSYFMISSVHRVLFVNMLADGR